MATAYQRADNYEARIPPLPEAWGPLWKSFVRSLRAERRSERTLKAYGYALHELAKAVPAGTSLPAVSRDQVADLFAELRTRELKATTIAIHFRGLRRFFNWLVEEGEIEESPMRRLKQPQVPDRPIPVLSLEDIDKMLRACRGRSFEDRRDAALISFLFDTGVRLGSLTTLGLGDVDLDHGLAVVTGKGDHVYQVPLGAKLVRDLDRYLRTRDLHRFRDLPAFWLGMFGPLSSSGVYQIVRRRTREAGLKVDFAVHAFRHSFSHHFRMAGGNPDDLQVLGGWKSPSMVARYGKSMAVDRAHAAHRLYSPRDRI